MAVKYLTLHQVPRDKLHSTELLWTKLEHHTVEDSPHACCPEEKMGLEDPGTTSQAPQVWDRWVYGVRKHCLA